MTEKKVETVSASQMESDLRGVGKKKNVATMTGAELEDFIAETEAQHREYMKSLRALMRVRFLEEKAKEAE